MATQPLAHIVLTIASEYHAHTVAQTVEEMHEILKAHYATHRYADAYTFEREEDANAYITANCCIAQYMKTRRFNA